MDQAGYVWPHMVRIRARGGEERDGQNTDPQSIDYPNGLPKWTTPKNNIQNEYCLMFSAANILKLHIHNFRLCSSCTYMCWKINTVRMLTPGNY